VRRANSLLGFLGLILLFFAGLASFFTGGRSVVDLVYIVLHAGLGVLALIAYLSTGIENLRTFVGERSTRYGANALLYSLIFVAVLGLLNYLSIRHNHRWDMSESKVYTLAPQSAKVVAAMDKPLELFAFVEGGINPPLQDLLNNYRDSGKQVTVRMVDPLKDPATAKEKKITETGVVYVGYGEQSNIVQQPSEQSITRALISVSRPNKTQVCFVSGHGEPDIDDQPSSKGYAVLKEALEGQNYAVKKITLLGVDKVPEGCNVVVAVAVPKPFLDNEVTALGSFLKGGGHLLLMLQPQTGNELKPMLAEWGVAPGDDIVLDQEMRLFQGPSIGVEPLAENYGRHEITEGIRGFTTFPMTRSVSAGETKPQLMVTELVKTGETSWGETDFDALFRERKVRQDEVDKKGPISVAVAVEARVKPNDSAPLARIVVLGSADIASNGKIVGDSSFNREFLLNVVGWLSGQSDLVAIGPKAIRSSRFQLTQDQGTAIFFFSVLMLPELLLVLGLTVWWRRSNA